MKEKDICSLEHTRYRCQYHIVFVPKYRRQIIYREIKADIGMILNDIKRTVQEKRDRNHRGAGLPRPYLHISEHSAEICSSRCNGIFEGEELSNDFRPTCEFEIQVRQKEFLGERILCGYGRT